MPHGVRRRIFTPRRFSRLLAMRNLRGNTGPDPRPRCHVALATEDWLLVSSLSTEH